MGNHNEADGEWQHKGDQGTRIPFVQGVLGAAITDHAPPLDDGDTIGNQLRAIGSGNTKRVQETRNPLVPGVLGAAITDHSPNARMWIPLDNNLGPL